MSKSKPLPSQTYLLECFDYNPDTGLLAWKHRPLHHFKNTRGMNIWNSRYPSKIAGTLVTGRLGLVINNTRFMGHRVIWRLMTGKNPPHEIDHINRITSDNRWCNLRLATPSQNQHNRPLQRNNTTGFKGVYFHSQNKNYVARIMTEWKTVSLGSFDTAEQASEAYQAASLKYHKDFSNGV